MHSCLTPELLICLEIEKEARKTEKKRGRKEERKKDRERGEKKGRKEESRESKKSKKSLKRKSQNLLHIPLEDFGSSNSPRFPFCKPVTLC